MSLDKLAVKVLTTLWFLEEQVDLSMKEVVAGIFGLASTIKDRDEDDFHLVEGEETVKEESATGYLIDRLLDAYIEKNIRFQYIEELKQEEKFELLAKVV